MIVLMTMWQQEVADGLAPEEVAAGRVTGSIRSSDLPDIGAWWLADGRDSARLRELAGASPDDPWQLDALWLQLLDDSRLSTPDEATAALTDVRRLLRRWHRGDASVMELLRELDSMGLYRYDDLDVTAGLLDEIEGQWGRPTEVVVAAAERRLEGLRRSLGERPSWPPSRC